MRSAILGFVIGIALLQMQAALQSSEMHLGLLAVACVLLLIAGLLGWRGATAGLGVRRLLRISLLVLAGACCGFAWGGLLAQYYLDDELPKAWEGRDITVVASGLVVVHRRRFFR